MKTTGELINIVAQGELNTDELFALAHVPPKHPARQWVEWETPVTALIQINPKNHQWNVSANSSLLGIQTHLPDPLYKDPIQMTPLNLEVAGRADTISMDIQLKSRLRAELSFQENAKKVMSLNRVNIGLGDTMPPLNTKPGMAFAIQLNTVDIVRWEPIVSALTEAINPPNAAPEAKAFPLALQSIELNIDKITDGDTLLFSVLKSRITHPSPTAWNARFNSPTLDGLVETQWDKDTLTFTKVDLERLRINESLFETVKNALYAKKADKNPTTLPNIKLDIRELTLGARQLGHVRLVGANTHLNEGALWETSELKLANTTSELQGHVAWLRPHNDPVGESTLELKLNTQNLGNLFTQWGYPNVLKKTQADLEAKLNWTGAPTDPVIASLNGSFTGKMSQGSILKVEPGAGRLLSLFSLQHLLKRITLDFSDVVNKGFGFDSIVTNGTIKEGVMDLNKLSVIGSSATIVLGGKANFNTETLDMHAIVLPAINAGAPALALSIVNPAVGIGTFVTQWLFKDQLSNIFKAEYTIQGSFDDPTVEPLKRQAPTPLLNTPALEFDNSPRGISRQ